MARKKTAVIGRRPTPLEERFPTFRYRVIYEWKWRGRLVLEVESTIEKHTIKDVTYIIHDRRPDLIPSWRDSILNCVSFSLEGIYNADNKKEGLFVIRLANWEQRTFLHKLRGILKQFWD